MGAFDIKYMPRTSIKGQVLANLVAKFTTSLVETEDEEQNSRGKQVKAVSLPGPSSWKLYVYGTTNQRGSGVGLVVVSPDKIIIGISLRLGFSAINNKAKYEALLQRMIMVQKMGGKAMEAFSDSRLVVGQVRGELEARDARMQAYLGQVKRLQSDFEFFNLTDVSRSGNTHADSLATLATSSAQDLPRMILVEDLCKIGTTTEDTIRIHQVRRNPS